METQTRFDLTAAITNWQHELAQQPDLTPVVRRELETHLRDTVAELQSRGLNNEESFWLARRRLGKPEQLSDEFAKADLAKVWRERVFWVVLVLLVTIQWSFTVAAFFGWIARTVSIGGGLLFGNAAHLFFDWVPIVVCAVLVAKGRFNFKGGGWQSFFASRRRMGLAVGMWIVINAGMTALACRDAITHTTPNYVAWYNLFSLLFSFAVWPSILLGLLLWLMPREHQQTPVSKMT